MPFVVVLDDYHLIQEPTIHGYVSFLLEHLPAPLHLVLSTRADPPFSLTLLRARGQMTELRSSDLRFTDKETAEFLNKLLGLNLSAEDVTALAARTEGWIAEPRPTKDYPISSVSSIRYHRLGYCRPGGNQEIV